MTNDECPTYDQLSAGIRRSGFLIPRFEEATGIQKNNTIPS